MRTINPILKSACQTGNGLPIASAVVTSLEYVPSASQNFDVIKYRKLGDNLTATLQGNAIPIYGTITISRGYEVGGVQYTEALPPFIITEVTENEAGDYEIKAKTGRSALYDVPISSTSNGTLAEGIQEIFAAINFTAATPEEGTPNSVFDATDISDSTAYQYAKQLIDALAVWPYIRIFQTETGIKAIAITDTTPNITDISIIASYQKKFYDWPQIRFLYSIYTYTVYLATYDRWNILQQKTNIFFNPASRVPTFTDTIAQYYAERDYARIMFLLADMELEDGDVFTYETYDWRIESIDETFDNTFTQNLFCVRIIPPDYLLLEVGDNILLENGDDILME